MDSFYAGAVQLIALGFLILALLAAALHVWMTVTAKQQGAAAIPPTTDAVDPQVLAKIIEALKGLVEALTKAPGWFAIFLAGALLHLMTLTLSDDANGSTGAQTNRAATGNQSSTANQSNTANESRDGGRASGNGQTPAGNGQAPAGNTQSR